MSTESEIAPSSALDPVSRVSEVLFGLVMVLSFTGSLSVAEAGRDDIREMLAGALGCNVVWGIIDALLFLMSTYTGRARGVFLVKKLQAAADPAVGQAIIMNELPEKIGEILEPAHIEHVRRGLLALKVSELGGWLTREDFRAALLIFALVFLSVFPVSIPFLVMRDVKSAVRVSNGIAIALMIVAGGTLAHYTGGKPLRWGIAIAVAGVAVVSLTIALGG